MIHILIPQYNIMAFCINCLLNTNRYLQFTLQVTEMRLKYFDTVPVASSMCVLKTGFLFVASEFGNQ